MTLVDENPYGKSERTISAGPKRGKIQAALVSVSRTRRKTGSAPSGFFYFVLLYSVILGLRPCWGADMRGRIVNNIFLVFRLMRIRFFCRRKRFPASALSGSVFCHLLRCLKYNWLICKNARRQFSNWMWRKELLPDPGLVRISSFWTRRNCFFRIRARIRIFLVWGWNCPVADVDSDIPVDVILKLIHFEIKFPMLSQGSVAAVILAANVTTVEQLLSRRYNY